MGLLERRSTSTEIPGDTSSANVHVLYRITRSTARQIGFVPTITRLDRSGRQPIAALPSSTSEKRRRRRATCFGKSLLTMATTLILTLHAGKTPRRRPPRPHFLHPSLYPHLHSLRTHQTLDPTTRATATPHANRAHASCDDGCRGLAIAACKDLI